MVVSENNYNEWEDLMSSKGEEEETKEECPYCDWTGKSVSRHLNHCKNNPDNIKITPSKEKIYLDYNSIIKFCEAHRKEDLECEQMFKHGIPRDVFRKIYKQERGGGGWSGPIKCSLAIINKMASKGELEIFRITEGSL